MMMLLPNGLLHQLPLLLHGMDGLLGDCHLFGKLEHSTSAVDIRVLLLLLLLLMMMSHS